MNEEKESNKMNFSFGWLALKLLGKSLYSNAWSAISELVANGFDAGAKNVYVYIDVSKKDDATIELFDDGIGMNIEGIATYVKVGFNKRIDLHKPTDDNYLTMGRKGIGKLAALYLSENYYLITKTTEEESKWQMVYQENSSNENEHPFLSKTEDSIDIRCNEKWKSCSTGTLLKMNHVNLTGLGDVAFDALSRKLSNYFALDSMDGRQIYLCVHDKSKKAFSFEPLKKEIAFKNMAFIAYHSKDEHSNISQIIKKNSENTIKFPFNKLNGNQFYNHKVEIEDFESIENVQAQGTISCTNTSGVKVKKEYVLTGWIGLHSSIDNTLASRNDPFFSKNKFYNPIQLRLYVRNKLAIENFLNIINNTQAFVNYIEGEIHFDILDEDDLPDIATSNRQSLDEHDPRVLLLAGIIKKIVNNLISKRADLAEKIKKQQEKLLVKQNDNAKKQFTKEVESEVKNFEGLTESQKSTLTTIVSNKIKGNVVPKNDYIVFISHSREDKIISDFIYNILKDRGAHEREFFYTSREDNIEQFENPESLADQIKKNILKNNVLLLFLTSKAYKASEFCMFEGGAGWATRSVNQYITISLTYPEIPKFLTNGKLEFCLEKNRDIPLNRETYNHILHILNRIIRHLNAGRHVNGENEIPEFEESKIPTDIKLNEKKQKVTDYMDKDIKKYWKYYITDNLNEYMEKRYKNDEEEKN